MNGGLMGQIANPRMADIAGALDYREQKIRADEERRKQIRSQQLAGEALSTGLREGSVLHRMASEAPDTYLLVAKATGIPANDGEQMQQYAQQLKYLSAMDPRQSFEQANQIVQKRQEMGLPPGPIAGYLESAMRDGPEVAYRALRAQAQSIGGLTDGVRVQSSENLPGGLTKTVLSNGEVMVRDASNRIIEGEEANRAINEATERGILIEQQKNAARERGKLGERLEIQPEIDSLTTRAKGDAENVNKTQKEMFDQLSVIDSNIANYKEGVRLLREDGANTGAVMSRLPSLKAASIKLDNLRNRLGLDVISGTTFGALSEAELKMALDTAVPQNLQPEEMAQWFTDRVGAQEKLRGVLENAMQFLSVPGNTLADLRELQKQDRERSEQAQEQQPAQQPQQQGGIKFLGFE